MTQDMKKDTILHAIAKQLVRNWRTLVRSGAHSSALTSALTQKQYLSSDDILASLRWQASRARATARASRDYVSCSTRLRLVVSLLLMMVVGVSGVKAGDYDGVWYINNQRLPDDGY